MLLLGALFLATAATGIALSAVFYGVVARFEADDLRPSLGRREWQARSVEAADHAYRAVGTRRMAALVD